MVMKRHYQIEYSSTEQALRPLVSGTGSGVSLANAAFDYFPHAIKFWRKTTPRSGASTYEQPATYVFPYPGPAAVVSAFADWFCTNVFMSNEFGGSLVNDQYELYAYQFVQHDAMMPDGASFKVNQAVCPLEGQYLTAYSVVRMHIQNVTPADDLSLSTDRVDVNPVKGKLMRFKDPTPVIKDDRGLDGSGSVDFGYKLQQDTDGDGIIWPNPATPAQGPWTQLPTADMFRNCSGMANISLEPGAIKDYSLNFKFSGTIQSLIRGFNTSYTNLGSPAVSIPTPSMNNKQFGQSFMFALEKRMPTGNAAVSVNFHYELYVGSCFGGRRKTPMTRQTAQPVTVADE